MSSNDTDGEQTVFGVPESQVVAALRRAGLAEDAVVALLGRAISQSPAPAPAAAAPSAAFTFVTQIAQTAPECTLGYARLFTHPDFIDGVTVVQAGATPDEIGFNARFHGLEAEFDSIARDLQTSSNCMAELRRELFGLARELEAKITEIEARLDAKGKDKEAKEGKETKEGKDGKDTKEKDTKEGKDKEGKDHKDTKEGKDHKDGKEHTLDKFIAGAEKQLDTPLLAEPPSAVAPSATAAEDPTTGSGRTFISLEDRPPVGEAALELAGEERAEPEGPSGRARRGGRTGKSAAATAPGSPRRRAARRDPPLAEPSETPPADPSGSSESSGSSPAEPPDES